MSLNDRADTDIDAVDHIVGCSGLVLKLDLLRALGYRPIAHPQPAYAAIPPTFSRSPNLGLRRLIRASGPPHLLSPSRKSLAGSLARTWPYFLDCEAVDHGRNND